MSLMNLTREFKMSVMGEFLKHCEGSPANVDPTMLSMLVSSYMGEEVEFPKVEKKKRGPKSPKANSPKAKKSEGDLKFERMPEVVEGKCMARSFAGGFGTQCTRKHCNGSEYCKTHQKSLDEEGVPKFGRIDCPRERSRCLTNSGVCGWKYFNGEGEVEEVCQVIERSDSEATEIMDGDSPKVEEAPKVEEEVSVMEEAPKVGEEVSVVEEEVPKVEEAPKVEEEVPKVEEEVSVEEEVPKVEEEVSVVEEAPKVEEEAPIENILVNEPVEVPYSPNTVEEAPKEEEEEPNTMEEEESEKIALIQGIQYIFKKNEEKEGVEYDIYRTDKDNIKVGYYDGEDYVFDEGYREIHELKITDEDQTDIEWI